MNLENVDLIREWLEFQVLMAVNSLKELDPNHYWVRVFEAANEPSFEGEDDSHLPSILRKQAD